MHSGLPFQETSVVLHQPAANGVAHQARSLTDIELSCQPQPMTPGRFHADKQDGSDVQGGFALGAN